MKIVALHTDFRIYWPARLKALSEALNKKGTSLEVIEIAGKGSPYAFADNTNDSNINWHILFPDAAPEDLSGKIIEKPLCSLLEKLQPDVILSGPIAFPSGALAVNWGRKHGTRIIVFDDSKIDAVKRNPIVNRIKQAVYNGVDALLLPAEQWIPTGRFWNFPDTRIFFGVDVVDNDFWGKKNRSSNEFGNYFVAVGRQIPAKNFYGVIKAYAKYVRFCGIENSYNLVMIGEGQEHSLIENCIVENGLENKVHLLPFMQQHELVSFYQNAKAICIASKSETWGLVINEAMAAGCPVFSSNQCGATGVLVKDGVNGYSFDYEDTDALSKKMAAFTKLSHERQLAMRKASKEIISQWGLSRFCNGVIAAIESSIDHKRKSLSLFDKLIISNWKGQYRPV